MQWIQRVQQIRRFAQDDQGFAPNYRARPDNRLQ
jgi:hypothetical protein